MSILAAAALSMSLMTPVAVADAPVQLNKQEISTKAVTNHAAVANYFQNVHPSTANLGKSTSYTGTSGNTAYYFIERKTNTEYAAHIMVNIKTGAYQIDFYWYDTETGVLPAYLR